MRNDELPLVQGPTLREYTASKDGQRVCIINGTEYPAEQILETYGTAYTKYQKSVEMDLLIEENKRNSYDPYAVDDFEVYQIYYLVKGASIDENGILSPHGTIVGARKLEGAEKRDAYQNLNQTKEICSFLKCVVRMQSQKDLEKALAEQRAIEMEEMGLEQ